jgi:3-isopropylmalate dehydrogenase
MWAQESSGQLVSCRLLAEMYMVLVSMNPLVQQPPNIAGQQKANPIAAILSVAMLYRYTMQNPQAAETIELAVVRVLNHYHTPDLANESRIIISIAELGDRIAQQE